MKIAVHYQGVWKNYAKLDLNLEQLKHVFEQQAYTNGTP